LFSALTRFVKVRMSGVAERVANIPRVYQTAEGVFH